MGLSDDNAYSAIRFSLGRFNSKEDIDGVVTILERIMPEIKNI
jgi:cysteine sulfinate desulfinase/cysteine desulfurase-like protein